MAITKTALFPSKTDAVAAMRRDRLVTLLSTYASGSTIEDDYIWDKLVAAEADARRRLRVFFEPTEIFPEPPTVEEIAALDGKPYAEDPAYDYDPEMFGFDRWGFMVLRNRPVIAVQWLKFAFPLPDNTVYQFPLSWVRLDRKYGHLRLVPDSNAALIPLSAALMTTIGGGRMIPHALRVRYTAGLQNAADEWPDLVDAVKKSAALSMFEDMFVPQSGSISADGLSQSISADASKYEDLVDKKFGRLTDAIHGIRASVMIG